MLGFPNFHAWTFFALQTGECFAGTRFKWSAGTWPWTRLLWCGQGKLLVGGFLHLCSGAWLPLRPSPLVLHLCWTMRCPAPHYRLVPDFPISMGSSGKLQAVGDPGCSAQPTQAWWDGAPVGGDAPSPLNGFYCLSRSPEVVPRSG